MRRTSVRQLALAFTLTLTVMLAGGACGASDAVDPDTLARIRVVNAISDATGVHLLLDDDVVTRPQGLPFGDATGYLTARPGDRRVAVRALGATRIAASSTVTLGAALDYTIVAAGWSNAAGRAPLFIIAADTAAAPTTGASVRLVHATATQGAVDVYFVAADGLIAQATPVLAGVPFGGVTPAIATSSNRRVVVTRAGTKTVLIDVVNAVNRPGKWLLVFMDDAPGSSSSPPYLLRSLPENVNTTP